MKNSSPISLFSFQDIITSLTGIMIVIVLVILLQLVESTRVAAAHAQMLPEYQALKKVPQELLAKREELKKKIAAAEKSADELSERSVAELEYLIRAEEEFAKTLNKKIPELEKQLSTLTLANAQRSRRCDELKKELHQVSKSWNEIRELQARLVELRERQKNISKMIRRKSKMLRFEFSGYEDKTPLLIECNEWGFRCRRYPDGEVVTFGTPGKGSLPKQLGKLDSWIRQQGSSQCYPVLLFREHSLVYFENIRRRIFNIYMKQAWGQELVGSNEEIF